MKKLMNIAENITKELLGSFLNSLEKLCRMDTGIWMPASC